MRQKTPEEVMLPKFLSWNVLFQAVSNFGVPAVIVLVGGWWLSANVATPLVASHIKYLDAQVESSRQLIDAVRANGQSIHRTEQLMDDAAEMMKGAPARGEKQIQLLQDIREELKRS